jgi:hypothetical protein
MTSLSSLPNVALFRQLTTLVAAHRHCTADIVEHLAEIDARATAAGAGGSDAAVGLPRHDAAVGLSRVTALAA